MYNQPTFKFESEYYNPETLSSSESLKDSVVRVGSYPDAYEDFRAPGTQYIVGVNTELSYLKEVDPSHSQTDGPDRDDVGKLKIRYELELDANYEIIGGEWRQFRDPWEPRMSEVADYAQPDILWIMPDGVRAWAAVDENIASDWNGIGVPPANWATASKLGSAVTKEQFYKYTGKKEIVPNPQPLSKIVYSLLELSQ